MVERTIKTQTGNTIFSTLHTVNVNEHVEKKNGLSYLSWAWAWGIVKSYFPDSFYTIYENESGYNYFTDGNTCWVKTGVTIVEGDFSLEHIEYLPVMNNRNQSIALADVTSFDVNKAIQRSLTKAIARHGLGLYIYAGEDLPEEDTKTVQEREDLIKAIDTEARRLITTMNDEQKKEFVSTVIEPTVGCKNYRTCTDRVKLAALLDKLNRMGKAA